METLVNKSHLLFLIDFECCSIRLETFNDVSPTFSTSTVKMVNPRKAITRELHLIFDVNIVFKFSITLEYSRASMYLMKDFGATLA